MPTSSSMEIPPPKNWQDFESLVRDAYSAKWGSQLQMNGKSGQKQNGVDIYGPDNLGRQVAIQCKRLNGPIKFDVVENELSKSEGFSGPITTLYIATIQEPDQNIQTQARALSEERSKQGKSAVSIIFWDDIVSALSSNPNVWLNHYPNIKLPEHQVVSTAQKYHSSLSLGYYGVKVSTLFELIFGEIGYIVNEDHDQFFSVLEIIKRHAHHLLNEDQYNPIAHAISEIYKTFENNGPWEHIDQLGKRISKRVMNSDNFLPFAEAKFLRFGYTLSQMENKISDPKEGHEKIYCQIQGLISEDELKSMEHLFTSEALKDEYNWHHRVFTSVENVLFDR